MASDKLQYGLKVGILMKMSSLLEELPNILIIIASLAKRFPSFRRKQAAASIHPQYCPGNATQGRRMDKNLFKSQRPSK